MKIPLIVLAVFIIALNTTPTFTQMPTEDPPTGELHPLFADVIEAGPYKPQWKSLMETPITRLVF